MAKSKRKQRIEAKNKKDARKVFTTVIVITIIMLGILFLMFWSSL